MTWITHTIVFAVGFLAGALVVRNNFARSKAILDNAKAEVQAELDRLRGK